MFITKAKKGFKPKAGTRIAPRSSAPDSPSRQSTPASRATELSKDIEQERAREEPIDETTLQDVESTNQPEEEELLQPVVNKADIADINAAEVQQNLAVSARLRSTRSTRLATPEPTQPIAQGTPIPKTPARSTRSAKLPTPEPTQPTSLSPAKPKTTNRSTRSTRLLTPEPAQSIVPRALTPKTPARSTQSRATAASASPQQRRVDIPIPTVAQTGGAPDEPVAAPVIAPIAAPVTGKARGGRRKQQVNTDDAAATAQLEQEANIGQPATAPPEKTTRKRKQPIAESGTAKDTEQPSATQPKKTARKITQPTTEQETEGGVEQPAAAQPKKKARKRKQPTAETDLEGNVGRQATAQPKQTARKRKQPIAEIEENQADTGPQPVKKKRKAASAPRKRKGETLESITEENNDAAAAATGGEELEQRPRKRKRAATPEEAANAKINVTEITMTELTADIHQGKLSTRETRLREKDEEVKRQKLEAAQARARGELEELIDDPTGAAGANVPLAQTSSTEPSRDTTPGEPVVAPLLRIVNGVIVHDDQSRIINHNPERTRAAIVDGDDPVIVEDDLSRRVTGHSFSRHDRPKRWDEASTALFYQGLQTFGMDLSMMACLFPGRSRRQLKAKWVREERGNLDLVNTLLKDRKPVFSKEELEMLMGRKLKDPRDLDEELRLQKIRLEEEQKEEAGDVEKEQPGGDANASEGAGATRGESEQGDDDVEDAEAENDEDDEDGDDDEGEDEHGLDDMDGVDEVD